MDPDDIAERWPSKDSEEGGLSRYAAFGLRLKQLFAAKASALGAKASVVGAKAKAAAARRLDSYLAQCQPARTLARAPAIAPPERCTVAC